MDSLQLVALPGTYAILRFGPEAEVPTWTQDRSPLTVILRSSDELTVLCAESDKNRDAIAALPEARRQTGWAALRVVGLLDFSLTGIIAGLSVCLADAKVSIFALSSFDTDYILVPGVDLDRARAALREAGYRLD